MRQHRNEQLKLIEEQLPELGHCKFADYFTAAIGQTLYQKFMANYTWKMWNIPGDELETSMVWADRFRHAYTRSDEQSPSRGLRGYDPLKFEDHTLGKGIAFQVYPKHGWNAVWGAMVARSTVVRDRIVGIRDEHKQPYVLTASGEKYYFADYHTVFCSIDIDELWGEDTLPYTGRMMIPLLIPGLAQRVSRRRRVAALLVVRVPDARHRDEGDHAARQPRHADPDRSAGPAWRSRSRFPRNAIDYALEHNLFAEKAYPQQSEQAFATYQRYVDRGAKIPNLRYVGRHAEFKYWGMPETVNAAYQKALDFPAV